MSGTPTILHLIADSQKHAVNPANSATRTPASITTTNGSTLHTFSKNSAWIIDLGATDHMTFDPGQLINRKSSTPSVVSNANGTPSPVVGEGFLSFSTSLHLGSVLLVPSLDHKLLSVAQLTTTLVCTVTFWPNHCVFQDILIGMTIGCSTQRGKLYYLDWAPDSEVKGGQAFTINGTHPEGERDKIWLWHKLLGHSSFSYLKKLFPSLFSSLDVSSFQCDTCELAKSHCVPFPLSSNQTLVLFSLVHSNVWGPAKMATPAGA
ncbi:HXXXD-type acyl-transferase family protein [Prunus dulcis]|uniref:HXXXD-type acyl-transferase family protein n=1 Tax=Prunus dulcis TaxID=3755 RepID=A0A4Y1RD33_PRUDU|nr:HXXXD-type acyl-transferase family protein [Prunus dulcis]